MHSPNRGPDGRLGIAVVANRFAPYIGGIETQVRLIGGALVARGHQVTVLTRRYDPALPARDALEGLSVRRFGPTGHGVASKWLLNAGTARWLVRHQRSLDCVLVTQFSATAFGPALANALGGAPLVLRTAEHGELTGEVSNRSLGALPAGLRPLTGATLRRARRWAYRRAGLIIALSRGLAREAEAFGFPPSRIERIPVAVDTVRFHPVGPAERRELRGALGIPAEAETAAYVGRLVRGKGLSTLVAAWAEVARERPRALLLVVGEGTGPASPLDAEASFRRAIRAAGLESRVLLAGAREDVSRYLQASDLFVFPSEREGFGNALAEAMSCGLPVVCSRIECGAVDELVEGRHGCTFEVGDSRGLACRILDLLPAEELRSRMGAACRALVERSWNVERVAGAYESALARVAGGGRGDCRDS